MVENFEDANQEKTDFFHSLRDKLTENHNFPEDYVFKFIVPSDSEKVSEILRIFDGLKYTLSNRESSNGKYTSCTMNCFVMDAEQVIDIYKKVGTLEGVIML